jgi:surface protein
MANMFISTPFNQPIGNWITSKVTNMSFMFQGASAFNQNISTWNVNLVTNLANMLTSSGLIGQPSFYTSLSARATTLGQSLF